MFYAAYIKTYVERDVRDLIQVGDEVKLLQFMTVAVSIIGQHHQANGENARLCFLDTVLAAYLTRWSTPEVLKSCRSISIATASTTKSTC